MQIEIILQEDELKFNPSEDVIKKIISTISEEDKKRVNRVTITPVIDNRTLRGYSCQGGYSAATIVKYLTVSDLIKK